MLLAPVKMNWIKTESAAEYTLSLMIGSMEIKNLKTEYENP
jgi:hypothetical protein